MRAFRAFFRTMAAATLAVAVMAAGAFAQGADTAYVPFVVNVNATVTAQQDGKTASMTVTANEEKRLAIPLGGTNSVWNTGGTQERLNAPMVTGSRGNITLRLPPQSYQNAEIALHTVNGKRVLRAKAATSEAGKAISRQNIAAGAYLLSVKGINGSAITARLTHSGGDLNIQVAFGTESVSPVRRLEKQAADGDWEITVSAEGYITYTYTLRAVVGINGMQIINLDPVPQAQTYTLTVSANPSAGGTVSPSVGAHTYDAGMLVTVTATANSGYTFKNWSGESSSTNPAINIMIDGNKTLTANFQQNDTPQPTTYTLTIAATAGGTVSPSVGAHTYDVGTLVTVTATANSGYTFKNWSGESSSTNPAINIMIDGNKTLTANFQQNDTPPPPVITTFVDSRDGKTYKKVVIGTQTWMGENLNYDVPGVTTDRCYGYSNSADSCAKYGGRLYHWSTAMAIGAGYDSTKWNGSDVNHRGVCPVGWHVPSDAEWTVLTDFVGGASTAGTKLKATSGWYNYLNGTDQYGWSALPGGYGDSNGNSRDAGKCSRWWSATEVNTNTIAAYYRSMNYDNESVHRYGNNNKAYWLSVRCVED